MERRVQLTLSRLQMAVRGVLAALIVHLTLCCGTAGAVEVKLGASEAAPSGPAMRVVLVRSAQDCKSPCAQWISAEGRITPETPADFARVLRSLGHRKVPVFIHSPGGNIAASLVIGRMLRANRLDVAVTRTYFLPCSGRCGGSEAYMGVPRSFGAVCSSACAYLIAGGVRRYVSPGSLVGLHDVALPPIMQQYSVVMPDAADQQVEISRKSVLIPSTTFADGPQKLRSGLAIAIERTHGRIEQYTRDMGVGDTVTQLAFATKPPDIHWMTRSELSESRLMTEPTAGETLVGLGAVGPVRMVSAPTTPTP